MREQKGGNNLTDLRDRFAAAALAGGVCSSGSPASMAVFAYEIADAMIGERNCLGPLMTPGEHGRSSFYTDGGAYKNPYPENSIGFAEFDYAWHSAQEPFFAQGFAAFSRGIPVDDCPRAGAAKRRAWRDGWEHAREHFRVKKEIFGSAEAAGAQPLPGDRPDPTLSDEQVEREIVEKGLTAPRVTLADVEANIASEFYFTGAEGVLGASNMGTVPSGKAECLHRLTFCVLVLRNGFTVTGTSSCVSPENFDAEIGRKVARRNAIQRAWLVMGYALAEKLHGGA